MDISDLIRADYPDSIKRGRVCLYLKKSLALRKIELSHITLNAYLWEVSEDKWVSSLLVVSGDSKFEMGDRKRTLTCDPPPSHNR